MIPKTIHYCWFGGAEKSAKAKKCIASWKKYCPDYEIVEWNESNFDVNRNNYTKMCYEQKKFAFLSDYVRLVILEQYGGLYFDVDVELLRPYDSLLEGSAFFGFEDNDHVNTGIGFGCEKGNEAVRQMIREYDCLLDGKHGVIGCPILNTQALVKLGLVLNGEMQTLQSATIYPVDWFNPYDDPTGKLVKTKNTHSVHWYAKSWLDKKSIIRSKITQPIHRIFGTDCFAGVKKLLGK